jgi:hypothetical protein
MRLAFKMLSILKELVLVFQPIGGNEDWFGGYQQVYDMTQNRSYEHHIQLVLAALKGCTITLKAIELTCLEPPDDRPSESWDSPTIPLSLWDTPRVYGLAKVAYLGIIVSHTSEHT